jgi:hypothetical protein
MTYLEDIPTHLDFDAATRGQVDARQERARVEDHKHVVL